jgi:hypothetical protein
VVVLLAQFSLIPIFKRDVATALFVVCSNRLGVPLFWTTTVPENESEQCANNHSNAKCTEEADDCDAPPSGDYFDWLGVPMSRFYILKPN